jgi:hypothetical protein
VTAAGQQKSLTAATAFRFVLILGIANGFADLTYEGARSVTGLGASAAVIGFSFAATSEQLVLVCSILVSASPGFSAVG